MEISGGDAFWINGNNEKHNRSIHNIVIAGLLYSNQNEKHYVQYIHQKRSIYAKYTIL